MPHESTVAHEQRFVIETPTISRQRMFTIKDNDEANSHNFVDASQNKISSEDISLGENGNASKVLETIHYCTESVILYYK